MSENRNSMLTLLAFDADDDISEFDPNLSIDGGLGEMIEVKRERLSASFEDIKDENEDHRARRKVMEENIQIVVIDETSSAPTNMDISLEKKEDQSLTNEKIDVNNCKSSWRKSEDFDIVGNVEIQTASIQDRSSNLYSSVLGTGDSVPKARQNLIKLHLAKREKEFTDLHPYKIFIGTWNVNGKLPTECLKPWLQSPSESQENFKLEEQGSADIYVLGFQELDLSLDALVRTDTSREDQWIESINSALPEGPYVKLKQIRLVGILLVIFIHEKHRQSVTSVEARTHPTGVLGVMGNKGGVAIRLQLNHSTLCFINTHLAAFQEQVQRRNQDFNQVYYNLQFTSFYPPLHIYNHDIVFWLGDLNYRIDLGIEEVKDSIKNANYKGLYTHDQLYKQREAKKAFGEFNESLPNFKPTYKFDPGTDDWDSSEKNRIPAWCDRILWKGKPIKQISYGCHSSFKISDHKPVSSVFDVDIKIADLKKEQKIVAEVVRLLDKEENECLPHVQLEKQDIEFGLVNFMERKTKRFAIRNVGHRTVAFEFVPKMEDSNVAKLWFTVTPQSGYIMPGCKLDIEIMIFIDKTSAPRIKKAKYQINDVLVLHLVNGKDFFITLSAEYKPSVFGSSIDILLRKTKIMSEMTVETLLELESPDRPDLTLTDPFEIPNELEMLMSQIAEYGMAEENILLRDMYTEQDAIDIRTFLDNGGQGERVPGDIYNVGNALLLFLESLSEPIIPHNFLSDCLRNCNSIESCKQILKTLPRIHFNAFRAVCMFLQELLKMSEKNKLNSKCLSTAFGPILLRSSQEEFSRLSRRTQYQIGEKKARFVYHFLENDFDSWIEL